jgi:hypothetical protein
MEQELENYLNAIIFEIDEDISREAQRAAEPGGEKPESSAGMRVFPRTPME